VKLLKNCAVRFTKESAACYNTQAKSLLKFRVVEMADSLDSGSVSQDVRFKSRSRTIEKVLKSVNNGGYGAFFIWILILNPNIKHYVVI
jgi:hypothetical protein